jgi:putative ABC transport system ATP-binding protein
MDILLDKVKVCIPSTNQSPGRQLFSITQLKIESGERVVIQGPSGLGKTTLLHLIAGLFAPDEGSVHLGGVDIHRLSENERSLMRRQKMSIVFQRLNLISHLNALENVVVAMSSDKPDRDTAEKALKRLKMLEHASTLAGNLSLGEQQRVAVARVLAVSPTLVLADEPTSSLDDTNATAVCDALFNIPKDATLVVVSHDHRIAKRFPRVIDFESLVKK